MKFGPVAVADAQGALLAHGTSVKGKRLRKAHRLTADDIAALREEGVQNVIVARLAPDDVAEDEAAARVAAMLGALGCEVKLPATGRVNLHAAHAGVFRVEAAMIDAINAVDPAITVATLPDFSAVEEGRMVATVKIIPFAASQASLLRVADMAEGGGAISGTMSVRPFRQRRVALIQTELATIKASVLDKTARITAGRLMRMGSGLVGEQRVAHEAGPVAGALSRAIGGVDMAIVFGASALADFDDVIPAAIRQAGGRVERAGMPVDPGNLIVLGEIAGKPVIGAPGCARSPALNGFDWVLERICADIPVMAADIARMGVGGLLMEAPERPEPRERVKPVPAVGAVLLAAGRSSRMGATNKLAATFGAEPLLRRSLDRLLASNADPVVVVLGNQAERLRAIIEDRNAAIVENPRFAEGLSTSLQAGLAALPAGLGGVLVALADMPDIETAHYDRLFHAFAQAGGAAVVRACDGDFRGNPVILPRALLAGIGQLSGDAGARRLIEDSGAQIIDVDIGPAARVDVDTPQALAAAGGVPALAQDQDA